MAEKAQVNGSPAPGAMTVAKKTETLPAKRNSKEPEKVETLNIKTHTILNVDEKIREIQFKEDQIRFRRTLLNHLDAIEALKLGEFDDRDMIILRSATGETYEMKSQSLCKVVVVEAKKELRRWLVQVEEQILS
jgi:hypothetical protein